MERITERFTNGEAFCDDPFAIKDVGVYETIWKGKLIDKLAYYEDREEKGEFYNWIPCSEQMPEEKDSIFAKWKGTNKWTSLMFEKTSDTVIATIEYSNGEKKVAPAHTVDGKWKCDSLLYNDGEIIAWAPLPEPYEESEKK